MAASLRHAQSPVGLATRRQGCPPGGLGGERQAHPAAVARRGPEGALPETQEAAARHWHGRRRHVADRPNALWALDFQFDVTADGRTLKLLNIVDEYTRGCPAIVVARSIDADQVVAILDRLALQRSAPRFVRFDHGPEFIAYAVADWCHFNGIDTVFIDPGSPWQNAWIESFNGRLRDELLNGWTFDSLLEAQVLIEAWRVDYNHHRPHSAHVDLTPAEFAQAWITRQQPALA